MIETLFQTGASLLGAVARGLEPDQDHRGRGAADDLRGLPDAVGAQGHWLVADPPRAEPRRPFGLLHADCRCREADLQGDHPPSAASKGLFFLGPVMTIMPALAAWAVVPFGPDAAVANVNAGLLFLMAITSLEVYGVIIAGWASNSKYAFLGALRASAQMVSYEIAMGFALVVVLMVTGS